MATTATAYTLFLKKLLTGADPIDFAADTIRATLHTSSYSPNRDTHEFADDLTNECSAGGGYATGGKVLADGLIDIDTTGHFAYVDFTDPLWTALTKTFRYMAIWMDSGSAATSPLIGLVDFGADQAPAGVNFTYAFPAPASGGAIKLGS